jgi:hypothetical protein
MWVNRAVRNGDYVNHVRDRFLSPRKTTRQFRPLRIRETTMFRFIRTSVPNTGADVPAALQFAARVTSYLNKTYSLNMKYGVEVFGGTRIQWHFDSDSLDKMYQLHGKMLQDREYCGMLEKGKGTFLAGSMKDTVITLLD